MALPPAWDRAVAAGAASLAALAAATGASPMRPDEAASAALGLLEERAVRSGRRPDGGASAGRSARLLPAADGWVAVNLPRPDDLALLPAWLGASPAPDADVPWSTVAELVVERDADALVAAGQELGLAVASVPDLRQGPDDDPQLRSRGTAAAPGVAAARRAGARVGPRTPDGLTVVDLSSLWAGPLCARLLGRAGARVVKVESTERPDGARGGDPGFFAALHEGHAARSIPFTTAAGRAELRALLATADVVVEGSRPRALARLGIDPHEVVAARPGAVWVSVTGYGRTGPWRDRVGFGDDCAAAGGLVTWTPAGAPHVVGDAVADPLAGMAAAALVAAALRAGGGVVVDVALREVARAAALGWEPIPSPGPARRR